MERRSRQGHGTGFWYLESGSVIYEIKQGPFAPLAPENLAPWSPEAERYGGSKEVSGMAREPNMIDDTFSITS